MLRVVQLILNKKHGKTKRERVEREVGGGIGMGNTCKPTAVSFQCMTKSITNKKIIIFFLKSIILKKKKKAKQKSPKLMILPFVLL